MKNLLSHLIHDITHLIKLSFNTPKFTGGLDALSVLRKDKNELSFRFFLVLGGAQAAATYPATCLKALQFLSF
jgi:hypothetical protein